VLLDCGSGVFGKLRAVRDYGEVDAIVVSHLHADHILDLVPYGSGLRYAPRNRHRRPRLLGPPGSGAGFRRLSAAAGMEERHIELAFAVEEYDPAATVEIGSLRVRFAPVPHFLASHAIEVADGGTRLTYSADTSPSADLCGFAAETDLLLIEATLAEPADGHLTPAQAGEHGRRARARRLVLTHISDELDHEWARAEAARTFGGAVEIAREGAVYEV
jgi:ribonuclease BN (tRNA processing enzyme)